MKVKGISFFELHAEKFLLGGAVALLLFVVGRQLLGGGTAVTMDGRQVPVGEVNSSLRQRAESLGVRLRSDAPASVQLFEGDPPLVAAAFEQSISASVSGGQPLRRGSPALAAVLLPRDIAEVAWYHQPNFPAVAMLPAIQTSDALLEESWRELRPLGGRFESSPQSLDLTWVTPAARVDLESLRRELLAASPSSRPPRQALPPMWFNDRLYIVDVVFERQRMVGTEWGPATVVAAFPTQVPLRSRFAEADAALRDEVFVDLGRPSRQLEILQPEFVRTRNSLFMPPGGEADPLSSEASTDPESAARAAEIRRLRRQAQRHRQELLRAEARLEELGGPLQEQDERPGGGDRSGGRGGSRQGSGGGDGGATPPPGGGGMGAGGGFEGRRGPQQDEATRRQRIALTERVGRLRVELQRTESEIARIAPEAAAQPGGAATIADLMRDPSILAWTHDLEVAPGETYRYRASVQIYNPFFARTNQLVPEQQSLAASFTVASRTSEWGPPVTVSPPVSFFVTRANPGEGGLGLGVASVEVYAFRNGQRRVQSFSVAAGEPIGRPSEARGGERGVEIDFSTGWFVVDVIEDPARDRMSGGERVRGVVVLVGRMDDPRLVEVRLPEQDASSEERRRFDDDVRASRGS